MTFQTKWGAACATVGRCTRFRYRSWSSGPCRTGKPRRPGQTVSPTRPGSSPFPVCPATSTLRKPGGPPWKISSNTDARICAASCLNWQAKGCVASMRRRHSLLREPGRSRACWSTTSSQHRLPETSSGPCSGGTAGWTKTTAPTRSDGNGASALFHPVTVVASPAVSSVSGSWASLIQPRGFKRTCSTCSANKV